VSERDLGSDERRLCALAEIAEGRARGFELEVGGRLLRIFAARRGGAIYAYLNRCPHRGTPLDWAPDQFFDLEGRHLVCSTHGAVFRVEDGSCLAGPCAGEALTPVETRVREGALYARLPAPT
jgi:nitrite reductase/ring-hydroxylating ferredoxin subunit